MLVIAVRTVLWFVFASCVYDFIFSHKILTTALKQENVKSITAERLKFIETGQFFLIAICCIVGTILYYWTPGGN